MMKKQTNKQAYVAPVCKVVHVATESFICVSAIPNASASTTETSYEDKGEHDAGVVFFGNPSSMAPAKPNSFWNEDEE